MVKKWIQSPPSVVLAGLPHCSRARYRSLKPFQSTTHEPNWRNSVRYIVVNLMGLSPCLAQNFFALRSKSCFPQTGGLFGGGARRGGGDSRPAFMRIDHAKNDMSYQ